MSVRARQGRTRIGAVLATIISGAVVSPIAVGTISAGAATSPPSNALVRIGRTAAIPVGAKAFGALRSDRTIELGLALKPRNPVALAAYANDVVSKRSPFYRDYLSPSAFVERFGPSAAQVRRVEGAMRAAGLRVGTLSANHLLLDVRGSVGHIDAAFHTELRGYTLSGGTAGYAASSAPRLPALTAHAVDAVLGINDLVTPATQFRWSPRRSVSTSRLHGLSAHVASLASSNGPVACVAAAKDAILHGGGGWTDTQLANAYGLNNLYAAGDVGAGQTIAVFELEPFEYADIATFDRCFFGTSHTDQIQTVPIDGFNLVGSGVGESVLDIEDISALAPAAKLLVYEAPNSTFGGIDEYNAIVSQDRANIVSSSWGECEEAEETAAPGTLQLENYIFEEAAAQGQTVIASAGDTGSDDCAGTTVSESVAQKPYLSVDDPASQPYVMGVGGTTMETDSNPPSQTVWNDGTDGGGGGGGLSTVWPIPSWQADSGVAGVATSGDREVPDVSALADELRGITIYSKGAADGWSVIGGTSSAAPTWAATLADIAASGGSCATLPVTAGGSDLGFVPPQLYAIASTTAGYSASFANVTSGDNDVFGLGLGYTAGVGYNLASGLGTPIVTTATGGPGLAAALCAEASTSASGGSRPTVASVTPSSGPISGGTSVTITGTNFPSGSTGNVHVNFGGASATVTAVTGTTITVTAPASQLANGAPSVEAAGRVAVTITVNSGSGTSVSRSSVSSMYEYVDENSTSTIPSVSGVGPEGGNISGGNTVTVYGSGFTATTAKPTVSIGGVDATDVTVASDVELTAVVPADSSSTQCATGTGFVASTDCQVQVVVTSANGSSATVPILPALSGPTVFTGEDVIDPTPETEVAPVATEYDYAPTPTITSIQPDPADADGSASVTINGTGFDINTLNWVNFGDYTNTSSEQTQWISVTPTAITIDPPAGSSRRGQLVLPGGVSVQSDGGLSNIVRFGYAGVPTVRSLSTLGGPATGGTTIKVHGSGLQDVTSVEFVSEASGYDYGESTSSVVSDETPSSLIVTAPAAAPGPVDVEPCSQSGCAKPNSRTDTFVYFNPGKPSLELLTPRKGPAKGGTEVIMFGNNLDSAIAVRFGNRLTNLLGTYRPALYPDGDPYFLATLSTPGVAGSTVDVTVITRTGTARLLEAGTFHYEASAPSPPRAVKVEVNGTTAKISWTAPQSDGGSPITSYVVTATAPGEAPLGGSYSSTTRKVTLLNIAAERAYTFRVAGLNATHGRGVWVTLGPLAVGFGANGYRLAAASGSVSGFGSLPALGGIGGSLGTAHVVAIAGTPDGDGYWLASSDGTVYTFGDAIPYPYVHPDTAVVGLAALPAGDGYWEVTSSGEVFAFGRARGYGSPHNPKSPVTGITSTPDGLGYYLVTASGAVYAFGDAQFSGNAVGRAGGPAVSITANLDGLGYWILTSQGQIYGFATLGFGGPARGAMAGTAIGLASSPDGHGYWLATSTGAVYAYGDATYEGGAAPVAGGYVGIATE